MRKLFEWIVSQVMDCDMDGEKSEGRKCTQIQNFGLDEIASLNTPSAYRHPHRAISVLDGAPTGTQTGV